MIYPAAIWNPGRNAGYNAGRNAMRACVCHYTVGRNSTGIGVDGYFHFLVSRDGTVQQFAELDAVTWHCGDPYNGLGPSIEVEYLDEPEMFTPSQLDACGALVRWVADQGIPLHYYDTGGDNDLRVWEHDGFLSHRACQSSADWHYDYWEQADWDAMIGGPVPLPPAHIPILEVEGMFTYTTPDTHVWLWGGGHPVVISWEEAMFWANTTNAGAPCIRHFGFASWDLHERLCASALPPVSRSTAEYATKPEDTD
jgi:N-acetylmuramoyl-L-alanine amidase